MAIRNLTEFLEAFKAELGTRGIVNSPTTVETETMDSSGTMRYTVIFNPRRPRPKDEKPKAGSND